MYLSLCTSGKMHAVGEKKHLSAILHARDPMRCAIAMLGFYFCYWFFELQTVRQHTAPPTPVASVTSYSSPFACLMPANP